jgi:rubrerythrin
MFTRNDLLDIAVTMEKNGETVYSRAQTQIKNKELKALLQWMAREEACHQEWFLEQKETGDQDPPANDFAQMLPDVLQEMMGEKSLSLDEVDFSKITHTSQMLETFIEFEADTILFYKFLENFIQDQETLAGLEKIIREETAHVNKLTEMLQAVEAQSIPEEMFLLQP